MSLIFILSFFSLSQAYATTHPPQNEWVAIKNHGGIIKAKARKTPRLKQRVFSPSKKIKHRKKTK
jgi:hypothetical protein